MGQDLREIGYWAAFDDSIVSFMINVEDPKFHDWVYANRELVSQATQRHKSVDELAEDLDDQGRAFIQRLETLMAMDELTSLVMNLLLASPVLIDPKWLSVAKDPPEFNRRLNSVTNSIKRSMKMLYGVPNHRPPGKTDRDKQIWLLKRRRPDLSFGQIGVKFNISGKNAERSYSLQSKREVTRLGSLRRGFNHLCGYYEGTNHTGHSLGFRFGRLRLRFPSEFEQVDLKIPETAVPFVCAKSSSPEPNGAVPFDCPRPKGNSCPDCTLPVPSYHRLSQIVTFYVLAQPPEIPPAGAVVLDVPHCEGGGVLNRKHHRRRAPRKRHWCRAQNCSAI